MKKQSKQTSKDESASLIEELKKRFEKNMHRHQGIKWDEVEKKLSSKPAKIQALNEMEITGGEPDVIAFDKKTNEFVFVDCSAETPKNRRSLCYDRAAWESRKENKPAGSAMELAEEMGIEILDETEYRELQKLENFDTKTSSWIKTPADVRKLGGALFCDYRYGKVFVYHNGAESYYAARAFRGLLRV